eukprot:COSAG01_NODE_36364_length_518_cov_31.579952_1_plen_83_part_10
MAKFTKSGILSNLPRVTALVQYLGGPAEPTTFQVDDERAVKQLSWTQFLDLGSAAEGPLGEELQKRLAAQQPGHCCSLIYTSG